MKISIDDNLHADYAEKAAAVRRPVDQVIADILHTFREIPATDRILVLTSEHRNALETLLPGGSLESAHDLVDRVRALASLHIGDIRLDFTSGQMAELKRRAERNGHTLEEEHYRTVRSMQASYFDHVGGV